jgi:hypothetical protein
MNESRLEYKSVISVLGPVIVAGLQLRKMFQGLDGFGSNYVCVYRRVTNQIHENLQGGRMNILTCGVTSVSTCS